MLCFSESDTLSEKSENVTQMDKVTLNDKEQKRLMVLNEVLAGRLTGLAATELLGLAR